ncbi:mRNA splicing protein prp18 [Terramyces sp. JEL0728]|nr:mRNA splicing protein prp18 [Terramyces sp. JEL0728]
MSAWYQKTITLKSKPRGFHLVTDEILSQFKEISEIQVGMCNVFIQHTSASLAVNESYDSSVREDMENIMNKIAPESNSYVHNDEGPDDMAEIEKKKKQQQEAASKIGSKYVKRGDLERMREEEYLRKQRELEAKRIAEKRKLAVEVEKVAPKKPKVETVVLTYDNITEDILTVRLRARSEPIKLFGEAFDQRLERLKEVESKEQRNVQVTFSNFMQARETDLADDLLLGKPVEEDVDKDANVDTTPISMELLREDRERTLALIPIYLKRVLRVWAQTLHQRPEEVKRATQGKLAAVLQSQTAEHLKPFFKDLKKARLPDDVIEKVVNIIYNLQLKEYMRANDSYMLLSIGIHERKEQAKVSTSKVAHAFNDEVRRKWIQGIKRIMTFTQTQWPPADVSKLMG